MKKKELGKQIRYLRQKKNIRPEKLRLGVCSAITLDRLEHGERTPDYFVLERILERTGKSMNKYEMGVNNNIILISADNYTMYMYKDDNTLWYWNSERITYHDYPRAGIKIDTHYLDYNGSFEQVDIKSIVRIEVDGEEDLRIVSICPCKENVLFLLNNGQAFASEYITTEIKDVEYYYIVQSNPQNSAPDIEYNMHLKGISFYKLDYENIVSISSDKDSNFYLADESGNIIHYIAEPEE